VELLYYTGKYFKESKEQEILVLYSYGSYIALRLIALHHTLDIGRSEDNIVWTKYIWKIEGNPHSSPDGMSASWETNPNDDGSYYIIK